MLNVKNNAESTLDGAINDSVTSLDVAAGEGANFPTNVPFRISIEDEILEVTVVSTDTFTVTRGVEGTSGASHDDEAVVELRITAGVIQAQQRGGQSINVETLSGDKTLTPGTDEVYQWLDVGSSIKNITIDTASAIAGDRFIIRNNADYTNTYVLQIYQGATNFDKISSQCTRSYIFNGTNWDTEDSFSGNKTANNYNIAVGQSAQADTYGTAVGYSANSEDDGACIGAYSRGKLHGSAIGRNSDAYGYGVALGEYTDTNAKYYAVALGNYSETERYSEIAHNINGGDNDQENNITIGGWEGTTANDTPTEIFCGGTASQRFTVRASSVLSFKLQVVGRDNTAGEVAVYHFAGAIKRDGSNNTALVGDLIKDVIAEEDTDWDVAVTADDTNEALIITVTGDSANTVQWAATSWGVETHF